MVRLLVDDEQKFYCFGRVKAPGLKHRKWVCIDLILTHLRCFNRGSFHASQNSKIFARRLLITLFFFCISLAGRIEASCHHSGSSRDNDFTVARVVVTPVFTSNHTGVSFLGEAGKGQYRLNGTWGGFCDCNHRYKVSFDYLTQKLQYKFCSGRDRHWMSQLAFGGKYQFLCDRIDSYSWFHGYQLYAGRSHAIGTSLDSISCSECSHFHRRIAGSWAVDVQGGLIFRPCQYGMMLVSLGFNQVNYNRKLDSRKRISGPSVTLDWNQCLWHGLGLNFKAQYTRAYNYIEALLSWGRCTYYGDLAFGVFGTKVWGKDRLPYSSTVGLEFRFDFGIDRCTWVTTDCRFTGDIDSCDCDIESLAAWLASPAEYRPEVLSIADQSCD